MPTKRKSKNADELPEKPLPVVNQHPSRKTGARRVTNEAYDQVMRFGDFRRKAAVSLPPLFDADYLKSINTKLRMLGNDQAGDCEAVRWANHRFLITSALTDTPHYPSQDDVWAIYKTQNPGFVPGTGAHGYGSDDDGGMDSLKLLDYLHKNGGSDGVKVVAYASVDATNAEEVAAAIDTFGALWVDIVVLGGNQTEFDDQKPWTNDGSQPEGGHAVLGAGIKLHPVTSVAEYVDIATWAAETSLAESFWSGKSGQYTLVMGTYVVVWPEHCGTRQFESGVNLATLQQVYSAVTNGKTLVLPTPPPAPGPAPAPAPTPVPTPVPDPGAAPFPGALDQVTARIRKAVARASVSDAVWLNRHFERYFGLPVTEARDEAEASYHDDHA